MKKLYGARSGGGTFGDGGGRPDRSTSPVDMRPRRHSPRQPHLRIAPVVSPHWELLKRATPDQIKAASWIGLTTAESWRALEWMVDGGPVVR